MNERKSDFLCFILKERLECNKYFSDIFSFHFLGLHLVYYFYFSDVRTKGWIIENSVLN